MFNNLIEKKSFFDAFVDNLTLLIDFKFDLLCSPNNFAAASDCAKIKLTLPRLRY